MTNFTQGELYHLDSLTGHGAVVHEGIHLSRVGDPFNNVYAVRSGSFKAYVDDVNGREHVLGFFTPGELIGFDAVSTGSIHANVVALETSSISIIPFAELDRLFSITPGLLSRVMRMMSESLSRSETLAGDYTAEERVSAFLCGLSRRFSERGYSGKSFNLVMSRRDIANYCVSRPRP